MAQTLYNDIAAAEAAIDESCKRLLADKQILARIMHYCVDEFKGIDPKEIAKRYIEGTPTSARSESCQSRQTGRYTVFRTTTPR